MFTVNNKETRTTSTVSLFLTLSLTLRILMSLLLTLNVFYIFHDLENVEKRALYWKKGKKRKFNRLQIEVPFLPSISLPPPPPPNIGSLSFSFVRIYAQGVLTGFYRIWPKIFIIIHDNLFATRSGQSFLTWWIWGQLCSIIMAKNSMQWDNARELKMTQGMCLGIIHLVRLQNFPKN